MRDYVPKIDNSRPAPSGFLYAEEDNVRFGELTAAVSTAGLAQAMARYVSAAVYCIDTGQAANSYILRNAGQIQSPKAYFTGLRVLFYPVHASNGPSVIDAHGLGAKSLYRPDGSAIKTGDIFANRLVDAFYDEELDGGVGGFRLTPWAVPPSILSPTAVPVSGEGIVVDGTYHVALNVPGLVTAIPALTDIFSFYSQTKGHHYELTLAELIAIIQAGLTSVSLITVAPILKIEERRPNGTRRAAATRTWLRRPLSNVVVNQVPGAALVGNQISLPSGTYRAEWAAVCSQSGNHRSRLVDMTRQGVLGNGSASDSYVSDTNSPSTPSLGNTWFQIPAGSSSTIEVQSWLFKGGATSFGDWRLSDISVNDPGAYHVDGWISIIKEA